MRGVKLSRVSAVLLSLGLTFSFVNAAGAVDSDCMPTPTLSQAKQITNQSLGSGVTAKAWRWYPGSDARLSWLSPLGTKVSVASGNLRNIDLGIVYANLPRTQNLDMLSNTSFSALATVNGDYLDSYGPWNSMITGGDMIYAPTGSSGVLGMVEHQVNPTKGYRSTGTITVGSSVFRVTGVNQLKPGAESVVLYRSNFIYALPPKGDATFVFKNSKLIKVYPYGRAVAKSVGTVVQVRGTLAAKVRKLLVNSKVKFSLPEAPKTETRLVADTLRTVGSVSSNSNTLTFDSLNYNMLSATGATLFDNNFSEVTRAGKITLRILPDTLGRLVVKNVYRQGYFTRVDSGGFIVQANGEAAVAAARFKAGDIVTISRSYKSSSQAKFINAAGRGARMVQGGKFVWICGQHRSDYRPRTAIGWNEDGQIWFMTSSLGADADDNGFRQGGSTPDQMGHWLQSLGATEVVLLDGGGSTTMQIRDPEDGWQRFDLPDSAWYRGLANAFTLELK